MKDNRKVGLYVSLFVLIGFPIFFLIVSLLTQQWAFLLYSIIPSVVAGVTGLSASIRKNNVN